MNLLFRRRREGLDTAGHHLATESGRFWGAEKGVYDLDDKPSIPVQWIWDHRFSRPRDEVLPASDGDSGVVGDLYTQVYSRLPDPARLVLLGHAGTGKSAAMLLLLLAALDDREENPEVGVPVWITLSSWNPHERRLRELAVEAMEWLVPHLRKDSVYGPAAAARLFDEGRVALFLDGLDEMPKELRKAAMTAVATEAGALPVVITCRSGEYVRPTAPGRKIAAPVVLQLRPLQADAVALYLTKSNAGADLPVWQNLADHIVAHPGGPMARALQTPLYVSLMHAAYPEPGPEHDPAELLALGDHDKIQETVVDQFLDRVYPDAPGIPGPSDERRRDTLRGSRCGRWWARATRRISAWNLARRRRRGLRFLEWTAFHLGEGTDLRWWQIPNWASPDRLAGMCMVPAALSTTVLCLFGVLVTGERSTILLIGIALAAWGLGGLFGVLAFNQLHRAGGRPLGMRLRKPTAAEARYVLGKGLMPAAPFFYGAYLAKGVLAGLGASLGIFFLGVVGGDLTPHGEGGLLALWSQPLTDDTRITVPRSYRGDWLRTVYVVLTATIATGLVTAFAGAVEGGASTGLRYGSGIGAAMGWLLGLGPAVVLRLTPVVVSRRHGLGYGSFTRHLRTAHRLKVIRQAGVVYQFRHTALQARLRSRYEAFTSSSRDSERPALAERCD